MQFFLGVHHADMGWPLSLRDVPVCISANTLRERQGRIAFVGQGDPGWMLDSGAFTQVTLKGGFEQTPADYAELIRRYGDWDDSGMKIAVSQDYMCEPFVLKQTGLSVAEHQALTVDRFDAIRDAGTGRVPLMPVLQGWTVADYLRHLEQYGDRIGAADWVGVGSVCKRQGHPRDIEFILSAILKERPRLRLHGFGVKKTALRHHGVRSGLFSADSLAWSYAARREGRDQNDWFEGYTYFRQLMDVPPPSDLPLFAAAAA